MQLTVDALVVRVRNMDELDRLVVLLTADRGLVTAYMKGARRTKGASASATELLSYSHFVLFQNRDRTFVDRAEPNRLFFALRQDMEALSLATYFCQLLTELVPEGEPGDGPLRLALNCLHCLDKKQLERPQIKAIFELRLLTMAGYMPDLVACARCGCAPEEGVWFDPGQGVIYCPGCHDDAAGPGAIPVSAGVFTAMRHILYSDFEKLFAFRLSPQSLEELQRVSETYLLARVERVLPALDFYKTILQPPAKKETP